MNKNRNFFKKIKLKAIIKMLAVQLVLSMSLILSMEAILRIVGFQPPVAPELESQYDKFMPDKDLIWALKKNWRGFEINNKPVSTNHLGLRGQEMREDTDKRILFIGDSVTFGHFLSDNETLPARLEEYLSNSTNIHVQVLNAGVPGYSTFQEETYYHLKGRLLKPDIVLLGFCLNDITERYYTVSKFGGRRFFMGNVDTETYLSRVNKIWKQTAIRQAIIKLLKKNARQRELYNIKNLWLKPFDEEIQKAWEHVFSELEQLINNTRQDNVKLIMILFPYRLQLATENLSSIPQEKLINFLKKEKVTFLDLLPLLKTDRDPTNIFLDNNHFSAKGARLAAKYTSTFLMEKKILNLP